MQTDVREEQLLTVERYPMRHADVPHGTARARGLDGLLHRLLGADALEHGVSPDTFCELLDPLNPFVASLGDGPEIPKVTSGGDVSDGSRLYIANCAACHGATGAGNAIGGGNLAANLHQATATQIVEAMRIGPGAMPRFAFTQDQEAAIAAYVRFLQNEPSPGGLEIGGLGAVAEGFVAIGIGLVLFVLATMFVGRRSHEGDPPEDPAA